MNRFYKPLIILILGCIAFLMASYRPSFAAEDSFTQKDRELLIRLDERLNQIDKRFEQIEKRFEQIDKRFEQVDKRFEQVDKRFEQVDKRFEQVELRISELRQDMNKRFEFLTQIMLGIVGAFAAIVAVTIGFAIWDRRTMIRPFESKVKDMEEEILKDKKRLSALIKVLKKLAEDDPKLASLLRSFSLL